MNRFQRMELARIVCRKDPLGEPEAIAARNVLGCGTHDWRPEYGKLVRARPKRRGSELYAFPFSRPGNIYSVSNRSMCLFHPHRVDDPAAMVAAAHYGTDRTAALLRAEWEHYSVPAICRAENWTMAVVPAGSARKMGIRHRRGMGWWVSIEAHPFGTGEIWIVKPSQKRGKWDPMSELFGKHREVPPPPPDPEDIWI